MSIRKYKRKADEKKEIANAEDPAAKRGENTQPDKVPAFSEIASLIRFIQSLLFVKWILNSLSLFL